MLAIVKCEHDAELASDRHAFDSPCGAPVRARDLSRRAREVPRKSVLFEEHGATVLVGDVEVLLEGTAGHKACPPSRCK